MTVSGLWKVPDGDLLGSGWAGRMDDADDLDGEGGYKKW